MQFNEKIQNYKFAQQICKQNIPPAVNCETWFLVVRHFTKC